MATTKAQPAIAESENRSLVDKAVLLTGGTTGIGRATALALVAAGARVLICGRHDREMKDALKDLDRLNGEAHGVIADIAHRSDIDRLVQEADRLLGPIDILINNAAISAESVTGGKYEEWQYAISANLLGQMALCHEAWKRMKSNGGGQIINVGSVSAETQKAGSDVYVATKGGLRAFTESFRRCVCTDGIKVTHVEPGSVGTDMSDEPPEEQRNEIAAGKMLKAEDIAACILYCLTQPARCDVTFVQIRPVLQLE